MPFIPADAFPWFALVLGLLLGSFYNVCIHRYIEEESILWPPSHCPLCDTKLGPLDLVPVLSWVFLRGKCRACGQPISIRYPVVELVSGSLAWLLAMRFGMTWPFAVYMVFGGALLVASFIDLEIFILPDPITLGGAVLAPLAAVWLLDMHWQESVAGALAGGGVFWLLLWGFRKLRGIEGMGMGDVKLMLLIGGLCGARALPLVTLVACFAALLAALWFAARRTPDTSVREMQIPFGPFLSLGAVVYMLYGPQIVVWWVQVVTGV